jgi:hypothetical protein
MLGSLYARLFMLCGVGGGTAGIRGPLGGRAGGVVLAGAVDEESGRGGGTQWGGRGVASELGGRVLRKLN